MKKTNKKVKEKDLNTEISEVMKEDLKKKEVIKDLKKRLANFEEPELPEEKVFTNIKKLKCDYTVYKRERTNCNMPVQTECAKCGKKFEEGDELYIANSNDKSVIICSKCAK